MKCPECAKEIPNDSIYCEFCGARIKKSKKGWWVVMGVILVLVISIGILIITQVYQGYQLETIPEQQVEHTQQELGQQLEERKIKAEEARLAEEVRRAEEARLAEEVRRAEEARLAEEVRRAEEARLAEEVVFVVVETMPEFPGGQQALLNFLSENVQYPAFAQEKGIQGRVICQFVVNKDGSIVDVEVVRSGGDPSLDKEAVRVINSMPKWKPGKQRDKMVRVKFTIPINFKLQ